jgi:hypothetical protein
MVVQAAIHSDQRDITVFMHPFTVLADVRVAMTENACRDRQKPPGVAGGGYRASHMSDENHDEDSVRNQLHIPLRE